VERRFPVNAGIRFGVFELDVNAGELRKRGIKIKLQDQPFRILALLLEHPGELVSREQLREMLWPHDTFVEFEHGINAAVAKVRQALGDSAENPRFVETVAKRGYRFLLPVEKRAPVKGGVLQELEVGSDEFALVELPGSQDLPVKTSSLAIRERIAWAAATVLLTAAAAGTTVYWRRAPDTPSIRQITLSGQSADAAASPDGKTIAFVTGPAGRNQIWLKDIGHGDEVQLTEGPDDWRPRFSPDGRSILFVRTSALYRLNVLRRAATQSGR
jgi:DNA-binding winged helix-turn-helix (wHTH) protein